MTARVIKSETLTLDEWHDVQTRRPAPNFTSTPQWADAWARTHAAYRAAPVRCTFDDGKVAIVPVLSSRTRIGWRIGTAMPWNEPVVVLGSNGELVDASTAREAVNFVARRVYHRFSITLWPLCPQGEVELCGAPWHDVTSIIDLRDGFDAAIARMDGRSRRMAGQAHRKGVECFKDGDVAAIDAYYDMLLDSARRWGTSRPSISRELLNAVLHSAGDRAEIWFARRDGTRIAGGVVLYGAEEVYFWSAAMYERFSDLRPSNALNVALIRAAVERRMKWYNMGSSSGLEGVQQFKDRLGAARMPYRTYHYSAPAYRLYEAFAARRSGTSRTS